MTHHGGAYGNRRGGVRRALALVVCAIALSACARDIASDRARARLAEIEAEAPSPARFGYCSEYGCKTVTETGLTAEEWGAIAGLFTPPAEDPASERALLAMAVGRFERAVGAKVGTANDRGGTFVGFGRGGQLDCVDEATNTTMLLHMLAARGLLAWHDVGEPAERGLIVDSWPHATATVVERRSGRAYTVDSWFFDNGHDAAVVPLERWLAGWVPR